MRLEEVLETARFITSGKIGSVTVNFRDLSEALMKLERIALLAEKHRRRPIDATFIVLDHDLDAAFKEAGYE